MPNYGNSVIYLFSAILFFIRIDHQSQIFTNQSIYGDSYFHWGYIHMDASTNSIFSHKHCTIEYIDVTVKRNGFASWEAYASSDGTNNAIRITNLHFYGPAT